jgi:GrpB-like predicted nucleotidyltransferase (UPF0157 family)
MTATIVARGPQILIVQRDTWLPYYETERRELAQVAGDILLAFAHVGSTAVPGLPGKPVIDILAGVQNLERSATLAERLASRGYIQIPFQPATANSADNGNTRLFFLKRPLQTDEGVDPDHPGCNIHVVAMDRFHQDEQLLLRDHLIKHAELAAEYGRLKSEIVSTIADYREYTPAKSAFIERMLAQARAAS